MSAALPASVEDWDDEAQASIPGTRATASANIAVKRTSSDIESDLPGSYPSDLVRYKYDGTDSGYASKAPTVSSMESTTRRKSELKLDTAVVTERERKPYTMSAAPKEKEVKAEPAPVKKPFCHKKGVCWVCDKYDFHFDPKDPPKNLAELRDAAKGSAAPAAPASKQATNVTAPRIPSQDISRPPARRMSTTQARPQSMYVGGQPQPPYAQFTSMHHGGWPSTPVSAHPGAMYTTFQYVPTGTPVGYAPTQPVFFEHGPVYDEPPQPKPNRRTSIIATDQRPPLIKKPSRSSTLQVDQRPPTRERPQIVSRDSRRSIDMRDADRLAMPPPAKPQATVKVAATRPVTHRAATYHPNSSTNGVARRRSVQYETDSEESDSSEEETDIFDSGAMVTYQKTQASPRRQPPSAYRRPTQENMERPQLPAKSKTYQDGNTSIQVAERQKSMPRRSTTNSAPTLVNLERREAEREAAIEAYIRKRGSMPVNDLTAENLKALRSVPPHVSDQRSESGSTASHATRQSSKDSSSGRGRAVTSTLPHSKRQSMNISVNGLSLNITDDGTRGPEAPPVKLDLGVAQISIGKSDKENVDLRPKALQRAPSMSSRTPSRRSLTQGSASLVSAAINGSKRETDQRMALEALEGRRVEYVRRESYVTDEDDEERIALRRLSKQSSRQASRNTSSVRQVHEELPVRPRSNRASVNFAQA